MRTGANGTVLQRLRNLQKNQMFQHSQSKIKRDWDCARELSEDQQDRRYVSVPRHSLYRPVQREFETGNRAKVEMVCNDRAKIIGSAFIDQNGRGSLKLKVNDESPTLVEVNFIDKPLNIKTKIDVPYRVFNKLNPANNEPKVEPKSLRLPVLNTGKMTKRSLHTPI